MRKPWYWKARKKWFVDTDEGRVYLGESEDEAYEEWRRLHDVVEQDISKDPTFHTLARAFFTFAERQLRNEEIGLEAVENYFFYLTRFIDVHGEIRVSELCPHHVTD